MIKALQAGIFLAVLGLVISLFSGGLALEENIGLGLLFKARSKARSPENILIITIEETREDGRPKVAKILPRERYGHLIDILSAHKAGAVVFDVTFSEPGGQDDDAVLADAIRRSGNVILSEYLEQQRVSAGSGISPSKDVIYIEKRHLPLPVFADNAALTAPFPLPKTPVRLNRYWTFKQGAGDQYTIPVAAMQLYLKDVYPRLREMIYRVSPDLIKGLPAGTDSPGSQKQYDQIIRRLRDIFQRNPSLAGELIDLLYERQNGGRFAPFGQEDKALVSLVRMYSGNESRYLNFYGPPGTIKTVALEQVLADEQDGLFSVLPPDLSSSVVFVGLSQLSGREQSDNFYTVFSRPDGMDLNGVEVAATAFANLLEDEAIVPFTPFQQSILFVLWGFAMALACFLLSPLLSFLAVAGAGATMVIIAQYFFRNNGLWVPLVIPLLVQLPLAYLAGVLWKFFVTNRERRSIKAAFGHYLPDNVVKKLARNMVDIKAESKKVFGICLFTDAESYTSISEELEPEELGKTMNRYYEATFKPVVDHGGVVSDTTGDAMLAIWVSSTIKQDLSLQACLAALDIGRAVDAFNRDTETANLPTRIGIHGGTMMLGNVGALKHYEYTPIGDVVNTASRLEGLNKKLGTRILVSDDCLAGIEGVLTRHLGTFLMAGKSRPVAISELLCRLPEAAEADLVKCEYFQSALVMFQAAKWKEARLVFRRVLDLDPEDGPAEFYLKRCERCLNSNPPDNPDNIIRFDEK